MKAIKCFPKYSEKTPQSPFFTAKNEQNSFFLPIIQRKLTVNELGDAYEQEADAVADKVMRMSDPSVSQPISKVSISSLQRTCAACEEDDTMQRKEASNTGGSMVAPPIVSDVLSGSGKPLDKATQQFMESRMGQNFSNVRIHTDGKAAESAQSVNALAYTSGDNIVFNNGQYQPDTEGGKRLLAHELVHVGQQGEGFEGRKYSAIQRNKAETTEKVGGTLWAKDATGKDLPPSLDDISQGGVNDCFLFAAMASIVNTKPWKINSMIKDNGNGTYTVTFEGMGFWSDVTQTVSADFAVGKHGNLTGRKALWPLIIEKAYIKEKGGLDVVEKGGNAGTAIDELLDDDASTFDPRDKSVDYIMGKVKTAIDKKYPITISSPKKDGAGKEKKELADKTSGLYFWHGYTIIDIDPVKNRIKLFNPHGHDHPNGDGWVDVVTVQKFFIEVSIND